MDGRRTRWTPYWSSEAGLTVVELLISLTLISVLVAISGPLFGESFIRSSVAHSADEFASTIRRAQAEAMRGTGLTRLHTDAINGRFWIDADSSWGGGAAPIPIGSVRDVSTNEPGRNRSVRHRCQK